VSSLTLLQKRDDCLHTKDISFPFAFFLTAFCISWSAWVQPLHYNTRFPLSASLLRWSYSGRFGPTLAAFFLTAREGERRAVIRLAKRGLPSRIRLPFLLLIVTIPLAVNGIGYFVAGGQHPNFSPLTILETFILYYFLGGSVGEEFGWRGYALDRLQQRWGWLPSALLLGVIWSAWHYPLKFLSGTTQSETPQWIFFLSTTSLAVIMSWVYNNSAGSLFGMLLLHTFENITVVIVPPVIAGGIDRAAYYGAFLMAGVALIIVVGSRHSRSSPYSWPK